MSIFFILLFKILPLYGLIAVGFLAGKFFKLKKEKSVSFFENNADSFVKMAEELGKDKIKDKFDWMFNRITSEKAKEIAKPWYDEALQKL